MNRLVIVVDADVDPRDLHEVMWAVSSRCDPERDIDIMRYCWGCVTDPLVLPGEPTYNSRAHRRVPAVRAARGLPGRGGGQQRRAGPGGPAVAGTHVMTGRGAPGNSVVLVTRETPLSYIHIRNMETVTLAGATVLPPVPAFYHRPASIDDLLMHTCGKVLDQFGLDHDLYRRWTG
jgi:hypothetical protein